MVDLGKHAFEVLMAYGLSILLIAGLVWISIRQAKKAKQKLSKAQAAYDNQPT